MSWTAPRTWVAGETITAALLNTHLKENMEETEAALATGGGMFFGAAANSIVERKASYGQTIGSTSTASTTYTGTAPVRTVTTSDRALVLWSADFQHDTADRNTWCSVAVSGATTLAADDDYSIVNSSSAANRNNQHMQHHFFNALTPGSNTFTMQYRVTTGGNGTWSNRRLLVIPM